VRIDASRLLPPGRAYHRYMGSLTTPPCREGVLWSVLAEPVVIAPARIAEFRALYPHNARPVQPLEGRAISGGSPGGP
jgi:carbonic anhydrase